MEERHHEGNDENISQNQKQLSSGISMFPHVKYESNNHTSGMFSESSPFNHRREDMDMGRPGMNYNNNSLILRNSNGILVEKQQPQGSLSQMLGMPPMQHGNHDLLSMRQMMKDDKMPHHQLSNLQNCLAETYNGDEDLDVRHGIMHELPNIGNNDTQKDIRNKNIPAHIRVNTGRWSVEEHNRFLKGLETHPHGVLNRWRKISTLVASRTVLQTRTHAQKYFRKLQKEGKTLNSEKKTTMSRPHQTFNYPSFGIGDLPHHHHHQAPNLPQGNVLPSTQRLYFQQPSTPQSHYPLKTPLGEHNRVHDKFHHDGMYVKRELATSAEESIDWLLNNLETLERVSLERVSNAQKVLRNEPSENIRKPDYKPPPYISNIGYHAPGSLGMSESFSSLLRQALPKSGLGKSVVNNNNSNNSAAASGLLYLQQQHNVSSKGLYPMSPRYSGRHEDPYPIPQHQAPAGMFNSTKELESVWMLTNDSNESSRQSRGSQENLTATKSES